MLPQTLELAREVRPGGNELIGRVRWGGPPRIRRSHQEGHVKELYNINYLPSTVLVDKKGMIRDEKSGGPINDWSRLTRRISALNDEQIYF